MITALEAYLLSCLRDEQSAREFLDRLQDVYESCDQEIYDRPMVAEAYAYTHLISRYCNWWDTFACLLAAGWFPMREAGLRALDVGAGPGSATYALLDFSRAVNLTIVDLGAPDQFRALLTPRPEIAMVESSWAMSHFVHRLSEERGLGGPYGASLNDFFNLRLVRTREMNEETRRELISKIMDEYDSGWDGAKWILREDYPEWHEPDRYHLCMISHFLTLDKVLEDAAEALQGVKKTLPPGGIIAVVGAARTGGKYGPIYQELERQMSGLAHLEIPEPPVSVFDEESQEQLNKLYRSIQGRLVELGVDPDAAMASWSSGIRDFVVQRWKPDNKPVIPRFRLEVFRAGHRPKKRRRA
ncbi:MAG TPA: hypothetical protein VMA73_34510 [Streptosporangiaceae bacterium]|nr:hypothetical protein [Streptosporangiaceae bacterium]